jgi:heme/copper-type cytochrome/quinol oxidase subunit 3
MRNSPAIDVSQLPTYAFGPRSLMWWGTLGMIAIEGTVFALVLVAYFYLSAREPSWPPNIIPPLLLYGTLNTLLLLVSTIPNEWVKKAAEKEDRPAVQIGMIVCVAFGFAMTAVRVLEFLNLNCNWDTNAYGSAVWMIMGFHTAHLLTDLVDTIVLCILMFTDRVEGKRFSDVSDNSFYWYFVVGTWLPVYAVIYWAPRIIR